MWEYVWCYCFFVQAEDGIRDAQESRGLGDVYKRQDLSDAFVPQAGQTLYIEPKKDKAAAGLNYHTVKAGETMHFISQKYAVRLKSLLEMNRIETGHEPLPGDKIWLRETKPAE